MFLIQAAARAAALFFSGHADVIVLKNSVSIIAASARARNVISIGVDMMPTNAMVRAAVMQAVEAGLLARNAAQNEYDWELMRGILQAALSTHREQAAGLPHLLKRELGFG